MTKLPTNAALFIHQNAFCPTLSASPKLGRPTTSSCHQNLARRLRTIPADNPSANTQHADCIWNTSQVTQSKLSHAASRHIFLAQ